jgi:hypothetical protein
MALRSLFSTWMDELMDRWMDGDGWMDGQTDDPLEFLQPWQTYSILIFYLWPCYIPHTSHLLTIPLSQEFMSSVHTALLFSADLPWQAPALSSSLAFWMSGAAACYFSSSAQFSWSISHTVYSLWTWRSGYLPEVHRVDLFQLPLCPKVQYRVCREWVLQKYFKPFYRWGNWGEELEFDTETPLCCSMRFFGCW